MTFGSNQEEVRRSAGLNAAIIAAVQAYLEDEQRESFHAPAPMSQAWKMALRPADPMWHFGGNSWKGID